MKKLLLVSTVFLALTVAHGQSSNWLWAKSAAGTGGDEGYSVSADAIGNVYVTGSFTSPTITFGTTTLTNTNNNAEVFITKYDANGNVLWAKSATGTGVDEGYSVSTDAGGNVFVTGYFWSPTITFGSTTLTNAGGFDVFIAKYDSNGNVLWANNTGGTADDVGTSVSADAGGNVFLTGYFKSTAITFGSTTLTNTGFDNIFIVKYDANGNALWAKSAGGTGAFSVVGFSASANAAGNVFVTGGFGGSPTVTFGSTTLTNSGGGDVFVAKYDSGGNVVWVKSVGGTGGDYGNSVSADTSGDVFVTGRFTSPTLTFGSTTLTNIGTADVFVAKYDSNGNVLWVKGAGGVNWDEAYSASADASGNVFVTGKFDSPTITFGSTTLTPPPANCTPQCDPIFIVKYDATGNVLCASALASGGDDQNGVSADPFGNAYITSDFYAIPFIVGSDTLTLTGAENVFVAKYHCDNTSAINELSNKERIFISPNPFSTQTTLQTDNLLHNATLTVYNFFGQTVAQIKNINGQTVTFSRDNLASGLYFVRLTEENKTIAVDKLVIADK
ncbi:MAG: T9SS type A sorting domain-containing protein [Bacteroidetes bacterium]|nr:T9SS type A sorting domain-containing protein [Bacteroidota bacterium]